jgi:nitrogen regulatory protein P-II 1
VKLLRAVFRPFKLDEVKDALAQEGVTGLTCSEVKGYGRQRGTPETYRGAPLATEFVPKIAIDAVVPDALVQPALTALERVLRTGKVGDGKIFVSHVEEATRVRTGDRGDTAV